MASHAAGTAPLTGVRTLGLLGGTFDPIHRGHLALAEYALDHLPLDQIWVIPAANPPHKRGRAITPAEIRWEMAQAAIEACGPRMRVSDIEMRRGGVSYTVDTLRDVHKKIGPSVALFWIIGRDNVADIPSWHRPQDILRLATIVAGGRPGSTIPGDVPSWLRARLVILDGPDVAVSSTSIREQVRQGILDPTALPDAVREIIRRERLYGFPGAAGSS